jgi:DNA polymerase III gamma/tau subunit
MMHFGHLSPPEMIARLQYIARQEEVEVAPGGFETLVDLVHDFRQVIHTLQCIYYSQQPVSPEVVCRYLDYPSHQEVDKMVIYLLEHRVSDNYQYLQNMIWDNQYNLRHLTRQLIQRAIHSPGWPDSQRHFWVMTLTNIYDQLTIGGDPWIQLTKLACLGKP